jgi:hypothetical protein
MTSHHCPLSIMYVILSLTDWTLWNAAMTISHRNKLYSSHDSYITEDLEAELTDDGLRCNTIQYSNPRHVDTTQLEQVPAWCVPVCCSWYRFQLLLAPKQAPPLVLSSWLPYSTDSGSQCVAQSGWTTVEAPPLALSSWLPYSTDSGSQCVAQSGWTTVEASYHGTMYGTVPSLARRDWGEPRLTTVRINSDALHCHLNEASSLQTQQNALERRQTDMRHVVR